MVQYQLNNEEVKKLKKTKGKTRGLLLKTLSPYLIEQKGRDSLEIIEKRIAEFGYEFKFSEISAFRWYPSPLIYTVLLSVFEYFNWSEEKAFEMGYKTLVNLCRQRSC